jgi:hypothetical protein
MACSCPPLLTIPPTSLNSHTDKSPSPALKSPTEHLPHQYPERPRCNVSFQRLHRMNIEQPLTFSSTARNAINSSPLKLPAELRHQIYVYVIDASSNNNASYYMDKEYFRHAAMQRDRMRNKCLNTEPNCHRWLGLLSACRQTYHEAGCLPLSLNILYFPSLRAFDAFRDMPSQHRYPPPTLRLRITQETHR